MPHPTPWYFNLIVFLPALFIFLLTTGSLRKGSVWFNFFGVFGDVVTRDDNPILFWIQIASGYFGAVIALAFAIWAVCKGFQ